MSLFFTVFIYASLLWGCFSFAHALHTLHPLTYTYLAKVMNAFMNDLLLCFYVAFVFVFTSVWII